MQLKKLINESERCKVKSMVGCLSANHSKPLKILDVGCGYGTNLLPLQELGHQAIGVEVNETIVAENRKKSLQCFTPAESKTKNFGDFDLIIMSHVIEHFMPENLIKFMDEYLDILKPGGHLLIATPLMSDYFYDDFDHVKPYQPTGIQMVFSGDSAQVQYYSRNKLKLKDLWYRKSYFRVHHSKTRHLSSAAKIIIKLLDLMSVFFYLISFRQIGKTDGWVGLFQKK
jgi:SAM-dependent methyltransferase